MSHHLSQVCLFSFYIPKNYSVCPNLLLLTWIFFSFSVYLYCIWSTLVICFSHFLSTFIHIRFYYLFVVNFLGNIIGQLTNISSIFSFSSISAIPQLSISIFSLTRLIAQDDKLIFSFYTPPPPPSPLSLSLIIWAVRLQRFDLSNEFQTLFTFIKVALLFFPYFKIILYIVLLYLCHILYFVYWIAFLLSIFLQSPIPCVCACVSSVLSISLFLSSIKPSFFLASL